MKAARIRVIAICPFRHNNHILVFEGYDSVRKDWYYRPLGGGVEVGERTEQALRREIYEELGQEIGDLKLIVVLENLFTCDGGQGHKIVFVYDGQFQDRSVYQLDALQELTVNEEDWTAKARWHRLDSFDATHRLVPEKLMGLLRTGSAQIVQP